MASYPSACSLRGYLKDLQRRVAFFREWSMLSKKKRKEGDGEEGSSSTVVASPAPEQFWLPGFFFPQSFLTTLRQVRAREEGVPADRVVFRFQPMTEVQDEDKKKARKKLYRVERGGEALTQEELVSKGGPGSAVVTGLHLQCARWDCERHLLAEARPRCNVERMPPVLLWPYVLPASAEEEEGGGGIEEEPGKVRKEPSVEEEAEDGEEGSYFECPVYRNEERRGTIMASGHPTNFVFHMRLPTEAGENGGRGKGPGHWIRRGVAAIIQLSNE